MPSAEAAFQVSIQDTTANADSVGNFFDVVLTHNDSPPTDSYSLFLFSVRVSVSADSGVAFVTVTDSSPGYIFTGSSLGIIPVNESTATLTAISWSDVAIPDVTVSSPSTFTLGRVFYDVSNNATPGVFSLTIDPQVTNFFDDNTSGSVTFTTSNGNLTINGASQAVVTPEPASFLILLTGTCGLAVLRRRFTADCPRLQTARLADKDNSVSGTQSTGIATKRR
ncbi:VPLPA-CTERM sorting domain-containing protein [Limnoglobus roseus]|nr:VPLPA-CTERM sorting domain-containing protein [Limnoglobus roseus]